MVESGKSADNKDGGTVTIHFRGELLPGFSLDEAKAHATRLFKLTPEKCDALFSGQTVVLRKGLVIAERDAYLARIARAGMQVEATPDAAAVAAPAVTSIATGAPVAMIPDVAAAPAVAEGLTCPNCGEQQPKRTLCRKCGTDMPRVIAAREQEEQEARAATRVAKEGPARSAAQRATFAGEAMPLFGLSWNGRSSRTSYLQSSLLAYALMGFVLVGFLNSGFSQFSVVAALAAVIFMVVWSLRMTALRLHDFGVSAWLMLLMLIPVVQFLFSLVLLFIPGKDEPNEWGDRAPAAGGMGMIVSIAVAILAAALVMTNAGKLAALEAGLDPELPAVEQTM